MSVESVQYPGYVPVYDAFGQFQTVTQSDASALIGGPLVAAPDGWSIDTVSVAPYTIGVAAVDGPNGDLAAEGFLDDGSKNPIPLAAEATVNVCFMYMRDGDRTLEIAITPTSDPVAACWSDSIAAKGTLQAVDLGQGCSGGETAVVITADGQLLLATYDDGEDPANAGPNRNDALCATAFALASGLTR